MLMADSPRMSLGIHRALAGPLRLRCELLLQVVKENDQVTTSPLFSSYFLESDFTDIATDGITMSRKKLLEPPRTENTFGLRPKLTEIVPSLH